MNKEEILNKSRLENKKGDERAKTLEQRASQNAYIAIMFVFLGLAIVSFIQEVITGTSFIDYQICSLAFLVGFAGRYITFYIYDKEKTHLFIFMGSVFMSIMILIRLMLKA